MTGWSDFNATLDIHAEAKQNKKANQNAINCHCWECAFSLWNYVQSANDLQ